MSSPTSDNNHIFPTILGLLPSDWCNTKLGLLILDLLQESVLLRDRATFVSISTLADSFSTFTLQVGSLPSMSTKNTWAFIFPISKILVIGAVTQILCMNKTMPFLMPWLSTVPTFLLCTVSREISKLATGPTAFTQFFLERYMKFPFLVRIMLLIVTHLLTLSTPSQDLFICLTEATLLFTPCWTALGHFQDYSLTTYTSFGPQTG